MKQHQIILGFSEIKLTLAKKCDITTPLAELTLWFTEDHGILYVHDYSDHNRCMALALYDEINKIWMPLSNISSHANRIILYAIKTMQDESLYARCNDLFRRFGYSKSSLG